jgi:hypothetical protein
MPHLQPRHLKVSPLGAWYLNGGEKGGIRLGSTREDRAYLINCGALTRFWNENCNDGIRVPWLSKTQSLACLLVGTKIQPSVDTQ